MDDDNEEVEEFFEGERLGQFSVDSDEVDDAGCSVWSVFDGNPGTIVREMYGRLLSCSGIEEFDEDEW